MSENSRDSDFEDQVRSAAGAVCREHSADLIVFAGGIDSAESEYIMSNVRKHENRAKNVILLLTTQGGNPHLAFRIARCLQESYKSGRWIIFIDSYCKSAGTLIACGANEVVMSDDAEFGPLDIQLRKPDELDENISGLTIEESFSALLSQTVSSYLAAFKSIRSETGLTSRMASEIASELSLGLFSPISAQIEPMKIGEHSRLARIAIDYGNRLAERGRNLSDDTLRQLVEDYPSHSFVIDRTESERLFQNLRSPSESEEALSNLLQDITIASLSGDSFIPIFWHHDTENNSNDNKETTRQLDPGNLPQDSEASGNGTGEATPEPATQEGDH